LVQGIVVLLVLLGSPEDDPQLLPLAGAAVCLFLGWLGYRLVTRYLRGEQDRHDQVAEAARIEGATLAGRTVRHHLANKLATAVGYTELLADDPRLPPDLEEQAHKIIASAMAAAESVDKFQQRMVRVQVDASIAGPPLLDVDSSTAAEPAEAPPE
jgi:hypothetical protein